MLIGISRDFVAEQRLNYKGGGFMDALWYADGGNHRWEFNHDDCVKGDIISIKLDLDELTIVGTVGSVNIAQDYKDEEFRLGIATRMYRNTDNFKISLEIVSFDILKYP